MKTIKLISITAIVVCLLLNASGQSIPRTCFASFTDTYGSVEGTGLDVLFTNTSTTADNDPIVSYKWNFGDTNSTVNNPNTATTENASHGYMHAGFYDVCLNIKTAAGCVNKACNSIGLPVVDPGPCYGLNDLWTDKVSSYNNGEVKFNGPASTPGFAQNLLWEFGDGKTSTKVDVSHTYLQGGTYNVCLIANQTGKACADTNCKQVAVVKCDGLSAEFTYTSSVTHAGGTVEFTGPANNPSGVTYTWSFGDGTSGTGFNVTHTYTGFGSFDVCLVATLNGTTCSVTSCVTIKLIPPPANGNSQSDLTNPTGTNDIPGAYKFSINIYPNPAGDKANIAYTLSQSAPVSIDVMDIVGNLVATVFSGTQDAGQQLAIWNIENAANGIYLVRMNVGGKVYTQRLSVLR